MTLKTRLARLARELPAPAGPPAAVAVFFDDFVYGPGGKVTGTIGEGRPWPPGSTIQAGTPVKWYGGIDDELEPGSDRTEGCSP
jgi:hypothetical protein